MNKTMVICSGGMDSVALAYLLCSRGEEVSLLSFDYGQRHRKELECAKALGQDLGIPWNLVPLPVLGGSALTDGGTDIPEGHYEADTMKLTVVPNRNAIMLAVAFGVALGQGISRVATAVHAGDHFIYPDCRPQFADAFQQMMTTATEGFFTPELVTPFIYQSKADIARIGSDLGVPWEKTWSCYKGGEIHCGKCGTCVERREAMQLAGVADPTPYEYSGPLPAQGQGFSA